MSEIELKLRQYDGVVVGSTVLPPGETLHLRLDEGEGTERMLRVQVSPDNQSALVGKAENVPSDVASNPLLAANIMYEDEWIVVSGMPYTVPLYRDRRDSILVSIENTYSDKSVTDVA